jgi:heat shock protein HtpX
VHVSELFSTHPATEKRIAALEAMAGGTGAAAPTPRASALSPVATPMRRRSSALDPLRRD